MRTPVSTYRLQITEDFDLHAAARRAALPPRPRGRLGLPLAAAGGGVGQQPRLRRVRPRSRSTRPAAGCRGWRRCRPRRTGSGWACWSTSCPTTSASRAASDNAWWWSVLTHGQASDYADAFDIDWAAGGGRLRIPVLGDDDLADDGSIDHLTVEAGQLRYHDHALPAGARQRRRTATGRRRSVHARQHYELVSWRLGRRRAQLPPLLRGQHARRDPRRGARVVRPLARRDRPLVQRGHGRRPPRRPPRRPARPRGLPPRPRRPDRRRLRPGREDPRARRGAALRLGDLGHHRLRRDGADRPGADRPGRPPRRSARSTTGCAAEPVDWAADGARQQARGRRRDPALGGAAHRSRAARRDPRRPGRHRGRGRRARRLLPGLPLLPPGRPRAPRGGLRPGARAPPRPGRRPSTCSSPCSRTRSSRPRCASSRPPAW